MTADDILARQIGLMAMQIAALQAERGSLLAALHSVAHEVPDARLNELLRLPAFAEFYQQREARNG